MNFKQIDEKFLSETKISRKEKFETSNQWLPEVLLHDQAWVDE